MVTGEIAADHDAVAHFRDQQQHQQKSPPSSSYPSMMLPSPSPLEHGNTLAALDKRKKGENNILMNYTKKKECQIPSKKNTFEKDLQF